MTETQKPLFNQMTGELHADVTEHLGTVKQSGMSYYHARPLYGVGPYV